MSKALEEYGDQRALEKTIEVKTEAALRMLADGQLTLEKIAEYLDLSIEKVKELAAGNF